MTRLLLVAVLLGCARPPAPHRAPPPPTPRAPEPELPGSRLAHATRNGSAIDVPVEFITERRGYENVFPTPADMLEERWLFGEIPGVCRAATYASDVTSLASSHPVWSELVNSLAGNELLRTSEVRRDDVRIELRWERRRISPYGSPQLTPPTVTVDVCVNVDHGNAAPAIARTVMTYFPSFEGHGDLVAITNLEFKSIVYERKGDGRDGLELVVSGDGNVRYDLQAFLVERHFAIGRESGNGIDSTDERRGYYFYAPPLVTIVGRKGPTP